MCAIQSRCRARRTDNRGGRKGEPGRAWWGYVGRFCRSRTRSMRPRRPTGRDCNTRELIRRRLGSPPKGFIRKACVGLTRPKVLATSRECVAGPPPPLKKWGGKTPVAVSTVPPRSADPGAAGERASVRRSSGVPASFGAMRRMMRKPSVDPDSRHRCHPLLPGSSSLGDGRQLQ